MDSAINLSTNGKCNDKYAFRSLHHHHNIPQDNRIGAAFIWLTNNWLISLYKVKTLKSETLV